MKLLLDTQLLLWAAGQPERLYEQTARPFQWTFTRDDLVALVAKLKAKELGHAALVSDSTCVDGATSRKRMAPIVSFRPQAPPTYTCLLAPSTRKGTIGDRSYNGKGAQVFKLLTRLLETAEREKL